MNAVTLPSNRYIYLVGLTYYVRSSIRSHPSFYHSTAQILTGEPDQRLQGCHLKETAEQVPISEDAALYVGQDILCWNGRQCIC